MRAVIVAGWEYDARAAALEDQQNFLAGIPRTVTMLESLVATVTQGR